MTGAFPWLALITLLALSGFLSASETALFSLTFDERERLGKRARALMREPRELLVSILLGNLLVNLLFFASAPRLLPTSDNTLLSGAIALFAILIFGEILPKTLALRMPRAIGRASALPLGFVVASLTPIRRLVGFFLELALRALGATGREESGIRPETLADVLEKSAEDGVLAPGEADLLAEIVELEALRVREIMTPRVDLLTLDLEEDDAERSTVLARATKKRTTWLPVTRGTADAVVGCVELRDILAKPDRPLEQLVMPVHFIPEVAKVTALLRTMHDDRISEAVVVDEWGGTAGVVTLEDIFEELVGELREEEETLDRPVVPLGEGRFRVSGGLSIRDWNERFGAEVVPNEFETVGGFVTALLGRIPERGDRVVLGGGLVCEVGEVRGRRVLTLDLYLADARAVRGGA